MAVVSLVLHRRNRHPRVQGTSLAAAPSSIQSRAPQICPPSLFSRSSPLWWRHLRSWWRGFFAADGDRMLQPMGSLLRVRRDFELAVEDLDSPNTDQLLDQIAKARSLRELWHLRLNLFDLVSLHLGQATAHERLERLNRHFPCRVQRQPQRGRTVAW